MPTLVKRKEAEKGPHKGEGKSKEMGEKNGHKTKGQGHGKAATVLSRDGRSSLAETSAFASAEISRSAVLLPGSSTVAWVGRTLQSLRSSPLAAICGKFPPDKLSFHASPGTAFFFQLPRPTSSTLVCEPTAAISTAVGEMERVQREGGL